MNWSSLDSHRAHDAKVLEVQNELQKLGIETLYEFKLTQEPIRFRCSVCKIVFPDDEKASHCHGMDEWYHIRLLTYSYDLMLPVEQVMIELDGSSHSVKSGKRRDAKKEELAEKHGFQVLHFSVKRKPERIAKDIAEKIAK